MKMRWLLVLALPVLIACNLFTDMFSMMDAETEPEIEIPTVYENIPQSVTEDGFPVLGDPDAPVEIMVFSSFSCPHCANFHQNVFLPILPTIADGTAKYITVPLQTGSVPNVMGASIAALCASEQGMFYEYGHLLYDYHLEYGNTAFTPDHLIAIAGALPLDEDAWRICSSNAQVSEILNNAINVSSERSVPGTPTVFVNGVRVDSTLEAIEDALNNG